MKTKNKLSLSILLMSLFVAFITGCSKNDDDKSIRLYYSIYDDKSNPVKDNRVSLLFPTSDKTQLIILGGDGHYTISNSDETVVNITMESKHINITPLSTGNSTIIITDNSGSLYTLNIEVRYLKSNLIIEQQDVIVIGDKLSETQKDEIQQKAALTLPVKIKGGFSFIYDLGNLKGHVLVYKDKYGENGIECPFEEIYTEREGIKCRLFAIQIDGKKREFILNRYVTPTRKSDMIIPIALIEILTNQFKADYPNVESVYTQQRINMYKI